MIIKLEDAQKVDHSITQDALNAFETMVRNVTNNNFQNLKTRIKIGSIDDNDGTAVITAADNVKGYRIGDTVEINGTDYNDGLGVVTAVSGNAITIDRKRVELEQALGYVTRVDYPADLAIGILDLIKYDVSMADKQGVKSMSVSRLSYTYLDVNASDNAEGYPAAKLSFLDKYRKLRW